MSTNPTEPDPFAIPAGAEAAPASRPTRARAGSPTPATPGPAPQVVEGDPGQDPRAVLLRLVPQEQVLAALDVSPQQYLDWAAADRAWPTFTLPDGRRLADAAAVLSVLNAPAGGAA